jgi:L-threonylcarbamoyladenylate synthase
LTQGLRSFNEAVGILNSNGILLIQTDTLPGLHARADNLSACTIIQSLKGRDDAGKPMVVLAANLEQARMVCADFSETQEKILSQFWPGPFSFILPAGESVCAKVTGGRGTVAVRVPDDEVLCSLIESVGYPLASTSANLAGEPPCALLSEAAALFSGRVSGHWFDDSRDNLTIVSQPSALIDLTVTPVRQLRAGPLPFKKS